MTVDAEPAQPTGGPSPPRRPTRARLQTYFLRHFENCGSVSEAAARAGIAPRTVQRWRVDNPAFAARYAAVLAGRIEILEDLAMRRATVADRRPLLHRGRQVATVERHNDFMLMRLLARFDRARLRERLPLHLEAEIERRVRQEVAKRVAEVSRPARQAPAGGGAGKADATSR